MADNLVNTPWETIFWGGKIEIRNNNKDSIAVVLLGGDNGVTPNKKTRAIGKAMAAAPELLRALKLFVETPDIKETNECFTCRHCGREWSLLGDNEMPGNCPSDDCLGFIARAAIQKATA